MQQNLFNRTAPALDLPDGARALSLLQPWATLVALGLKQLETRSWYTGHRGPLLIHASLGKPTVARFVAEQVPVLARALAAAGLTFDTLPRGGIVAACQLTGCRRILEAGQKPTNPRELDPATLCLAEREAGDYTAGRFAWTLANVQALAEPVKCAGALQLWAVPAEVLAQLRR